MSDTNSGHDSSSGNNDWSQSASDPYGSDPYASAPPPEQPPAPSPYQQQQPYSASSASEWPSYPGSQPSASEPYPSTPAYGQPASPDQNYPAAPYGSNPYGANPYAAAGYAGQYGYAPPNHPSAATAMVLGIVGLAVCPFVGIGGFVMGGRARREIDANPQAYGGRGMATAGWVLGIIAIVYAAVVVVFGLLAVIGGLASTN